MAILNRILSVRERILVETAPEILRDVSRHTYTQSISRRQSSAKPDRRLYPYEQYVRLASRTMGTVE